MDLTSMGLPFNDRWGNCSLCHSVNPEQQLWGVCFSNMDLQVCVAEVSVCPSH